MTTHAGTTDNPGTAMPPTAGRDKSPLQAIRQVLCATDLGPASDEAIRQAAAIAGATGASLEILHVVAMPAPAPVAEVPPIMPSMDELVRSGQAELERRVSAAGVEAGVPRRAVVATQAIHAEITARAGALSADLLVLASHQGSALGRVLLGSVADQVVRHAECPVLITRPTPTRGTVLATTDLSDASRLAVQAAASEARRRDADLVVTHCLDLPPEGVGLGGAAVVPAPPDAPDARSVGREEARQRVEDFLQRAGVEARVVIEDAPPIRGIVTLAETLPAELVVVGTTGKSAIARLLLGSTAEAVIHKAPCSVLAVRARAD
jgi:nucleotide-binding universal stress UspA family protein